MSVNEIVNIENVIINLIPDYRKVNHFVFIEIKQQHIQYITTTKTTKKKKNQCSLKINAGQVIVYFQNNKYNIIIWVIEKTF